MIVPRDRVSSGRFIYIACPWAPAGGGMYKVGDYLVQGQAWNTPPHSAQLRILDTRGGGSAVSSLKVLTGALFRLAAGRISGRLAGVHVNMAERLSLFRKSTVVIASHVLGVPVVIHLHAQMREFYRALPSPFRWLTRWTFSLAAGVIVIGPSARRFVVEELRVPPDRVEIVINGVPQIIQSRSKSVAGTVAVRRILYVGRLSALKGVPDLLQALSQPGFSADLVRVTLAGDGNLREYERKARELGIDGFVHFEGWCEQSKLQRLLACSDVLVLPSHDEVLPLAILEAMANRVAVVCTPVGEIPHLLTDGVDAIFVPPGDVEALAAALRKVIESPTVLDVLSHNAHALYQRRFSIARFFENVAQIHQQHFGVAGKLPATGCFSNEAEW
jgi:glycosyltransferase involved in cell wall biosynthesis